MKITPAVFRFIGLGSASKSIISVGQFLDLSAFPVICTSLMLLLSFKVISGLSAELSREV